MHLSLAISGDRRSDGPDSPNVDECCCEPGKAEPIPTGEQLSPSGRARSTAWRRLSSTVSHGAPEVTFNTFNASSSDIAGKGGGVEEPHATAVLAW
jgi:hypothetical protein